MASDPVRPVRIRREVVKCRYCRGKRVYKYNQLMLRIPAKFKDLVEPFVGKDLNVEAKLEGTNLIIKAKPVEHPVKTF